MVAFKDSELQHYYHYSLTLLEALEFKIDPRHGERHGEMRFCQNHTFYNQCINMTNPWMTKLGTKLLKSNNSKEKQPLVIILNECALCVLCMTEEKR